MPRSLVRSALAGLATTATLLVLTASTASAQEARDTLPDGRPVVDAPPIEVVVDRLKTVGSDARAFRLPGSAHYLGPEELAEIPTLYDDANRLLRSVPGVYVQEEEGYGLRPNVGIRGSGSERSSKITLMEDGVLVAPAPYSAPAAYYFPVVGRMEAIEVRKGSSQVRHGPFTVGGAVNLVSSSIPERFSALADVDGGSDATGVARLRAGGSSDRFGWLAETYQIRTDGFKRLDGGGDTGFEISDWLVKARVRSAPDAARPHELTLKLGRTDETSNETYLGLTGEDFEVDPFRRYAGSQRDVMEAEHAQATLTWLFRPTSSIDLTTVVYRNDFDRNWYKLGSVLGVGIADVLDDPASHSEALAVLKGADSGDDALSVTAGKRGYYGQGVQTIVGFRAGSHAAELGVRLHADEEDRFQHADAYRMSDGRMTLTTAGAPGSNSNRVSEASAWAAFVQDEIALGRWTVTPGLRWESIDFTRTDYATDDPGREAPTRVHENDVSAWIPGIGAMFEWSDGVAIFGGVHRGFGPPGPGADEDTRAEKSVNYELGLKADREALATQLVGFYSDYSNVLGRATLATGDPTGAGELFNGGSAVVAGIEAAVEVDAGWLAGSGLSVPVRLAYTLTHAEFGSSFESGFEPWGDVAEGDELPYLPEHQLSASVGVERGRWDGALALQAVSEMRTVAGRGEIPAGEGTDAFAIWSASAGYAITPWATIQAGVENLTDEVYVVARRPAGARPGLPRTFQAGVRLTH